MHRKAEPYSGANPVPKAATDLKSLVNSERATETKSQKLNQAVAVEQKATEKRTGKMENGRVLSVRDPTTGDEVEIRNAEETHGDRTSGQNVLDMDFPPLDWAQHRQYILTVATSNMAMIVTAYTASVLLMHFIPLPFVQQHSLPRLIVSLLLPSMTAYILLFRLRRLSRSDFEDRAWYSEKIRGLRAGSDLDGDGTVETEERIKESAEWANTLLSGLWPIVNPQLFQSSIDLLEDIMQSSVPSFIHSVRVADLHQGNTPVRISAIRSLRDVDTDESMEHLEASEREQLDGDHINIEVAFAYRAAPSGTSTSSKARNAHMLVEFFMGIKGFWAFRVPVWVELKGMVGTARARLQLISDPPFVKTTLVTMMGLPRISIEVTPTRVLPNVMNLPILSQFISSSIDAAAAEYVAPRSIHFDLQQLISGDSIKKDTNAIGVLVIHIHHASGIQKMDSGGSSGLIFSSTVAQYQLNDFELVDPYVTLTFSRLGKPMFSTRIIKADLNPVFEETAMLLVNLDNVKLREQLSIQLWDSDRMSADDMMGYVEIDIADRIRHKNTTIRRVYTLESPDSKGRTGSVEFTLGYFAKMRPNSALKTDGSDPGIPEDLRKAPDFKEAKATALNDLEAAVLVTPPDPEYPTGILSVEVHEITGLSVRTDGKETTGKRDGEKGQKEGGEEHEEGVGLPSSYCTISLNDELVYETRTKPLSSSPMFNAGTERLVRNWRQSHLTVTVKDSRERENDAILGIVVLKLSELFVNASQITRSYPLEKGGRIRISLLFRSVELNLPPNLLGFDTGTIKLRKIAAKTSDIDIDLSNCEIQLSTSRSTGKLKVANKKIDEDGTISWKTKVTHLPVRQRYGSALFIAFKTGTLAGSMTRALAVLWLHDLVDNEPSMVGVALWTARNNDYSRLKQNYVPCNGNLDSWVSDEENISRIGTVWLAATFIPGVSDAHRRMLDSSDGKRGVWEEFVREKAGGLRRGVGNDIPEGQRLGHDDQNVTGTERSIVANPESKGIVPQEEAEVVDEQDEQRGGNKDETPHDDEGALGRRWHHWKQEEEELHRDHLGIMQKKPARTVKWLKDNIEMAGHKAKARFSHREREVFVETEV